jgi:hypothetical protein
MTLDPVHLEGVADMARRISHDVGDTDHRDEAVRAWEGFLDPLYDDGEVVLEPVGDLARRRAPTQELGLQENGFDVVHGLDAGTMTPRTFGNGLVLDVAQAAMSATPSDLTLHRSRTMVAALHSNDATVKPGGDDWFEHDDGYVRQRVVEAPGVSRYEKIVVHALSLYLAESEHAREHADDVSDLLVLDGPIYPKGILNWQARSDELASLLSESGVVRDILENYVALVESFVERDVPLAGFVKNTSSRGLVNTLKRKTNAPWAHDMAFFTRVLEPRDDATDELRWTNWFASRLGVDGALATLGDRLGLEFALDPADYEVCFFVVYDPRTEIGYKVETPRAFARDPERRRHLARYVLSEVAAERGPPLPVGKADDIAHIGRVGNESLISVLEDQFDAALDRNYDDHRWGGDAE